MPARRPAGANGWSSSPSSNGEFGTEFPNSPGRKLSGGFWARLFASKGEVGGGLKASFEGCRAARRAQGRALWLETDTGFVVEPELALPGLLERRFQPLTSTQTLDPLVIDIRIQVEYPNGTRMCCWGEPGWR